MKDRLKKKLQAKKLRQQSNPNASRNMSEFYQKHFQTLNALATDKDIMAKYKDRQSERDEKTSAAIAKGMESIEKLYIIMKHQMPHLFEDFKKTVLEGFSPEEQQEFLDRINHLEATKLKEILEGK